MVAYGSDEAWHALGDRTPAGRRRMLAEEPRAVGELASGVAHNVNNVLAAILGYAELIQEMEEISPETKRYANTIAHAALDGAEIVCRVQQFARMNTMASQTTFDLRSAMPWYGDTALTRTTCGRAREWQSLEGLSRTRAREFTWRAIEGW